MPMGWTSNVAGGTNRTPADARNQSTRQGFFDLVADTAITVIDSVVELTHRVIDAQVWTRWETASDEKVCPICGPYTGQVWRVDEGPSPPLHPNCRCQRVFAFTTWTVRE